MTISRTSTISYKYEGPYLVDIVTIADDPELHPKGIRGRRGLLEAHSYDPAHGVVTVHCFPPGTNAIPLYGGGIRVTLELRFVEIEEI